MTSRIVVPLPAKADEYGRRWTLEHRRHRPKTMNAYRTLHWRERTAYDTELRHAFKILARAEKIPPLKAVIVTAVQVCRPGTTLPDPGACFPDMKAAIDGLVDARVIPDDTGRYVKAQTLVAPEHADQDALLILVEELEP